MRRQRLLVFLILINNLTIAMATPALPPSAANKSQAAPLITPPAPFSLESKAFRNQEAIPETYTCHGQDIAPALNWVNPPPNTQSFVLIMADPDAPKGIWYHWSLFNLSNTTHELVENLFQLPPGTQTGTNSWGNATYNGPCPPTGTHHYIFTLYALDDTLPLTTGVSTDAILGAMQGHILAKAELIGISSH